MAVMVVFAMLQFVLPEFAAIYQTFNTPLPALTQWIITIAHCSSQWGWLAVALGLVAVATSFDKAETVLAHSAPEIAAQPPGHRADGERAKLTQIFTVLALTQNAGIPFCRGLRALPKRWLTLSGLNV